MPKTLTKAEAMEELSGHPLQGPFYSEGCTAVKRCLLVGK